MFNLQSIANNTAEQNARSKLAIQREVSSQLGLGSNSQFEQFKNSLNDSLWNINMQMDNIFNADDLNNYMSNLSEFGITSIDMAKQQLKATIMGNKYLGVSTETQQQVFKYMRRTNNNDAMNEHNRMIVGLLNSQLGVSKQQLDALTQKSYTDAEALAALGLDEEGQKRYIQESTASKSVMESINKGWGESLGNVFSEMIAMPYDQMMNKYGKVFGNDTVGIYNQLSQGNAVEATKSILGSDYLRSLLEGKSRAESSATLASLGLSDSASLVNMIKYFGSGNKLR